MNQKYISLINMFLSLSCGIIGSIELFYGFSKQMEVESVGSREFYVLATDIYKYLSLNRENRVVTGATFLTEIYSRYIKLIESSIILKKRIEDKLVSIDAVAVPSPLPLTISTDTFTNSTESL
jgi:hypothetical protein